MRCGLFGKLPAKRDFIAFSAPREFLGPWEKWLQGGLSASRSQLGEAWQEAFLKAPIWRFWLGADLCGVAVLGAFMPSVDGIGRYFPLSVFAPAEAEAPIPPPELDAQEGWFAAAEELLLSALAPEARFEDLAVAASGLPLPSTQGVAPGLAVRRLGDGSRAVAIAERATGEAFAAMRIDDHGRAYAGMSYWWTIGGDDFAPLALAAYGLPDPYLFAGLLTGRFDGEPP